MLQVDMTIGTYSFFFVPTTWPREILSDFKRLKSDSKSCWRKPGSSPAVKKRGCLGYIGDEQLPS